MTELKPEKLCDSLQIESEGSGVCECGPWQSFDEDDDDEVFPPWLPRLSV